MSHYNKQNYFYNPVTGIPIELFNYNSNDKGYNNVKNSILKGGNVARNAKEQIEKETGKKIVTSANHKDIKQIDNN